MSNHLTGVNFNGFVVAPAFRWRELITLSLPPGDEKVTSKNELQLCGWIATQQKLALLPLYSPLGFSQFQRSSHNCDFAFGIALLVTRSKAKESAEEEILRIANEKLKWNWKRGVSGAGWGDTAIFERVRGEENKVQPEELVASFFFIFAFVFLSFFHSISFRFIPLCRLYV